MREEVVGTKEVYKSCFFVGCAAAVVLIMATIGYLIWVFVFYDPFKA